MPCAGPFHLHLAGTIARVNIVELLLSAQACVVFHLSIEELIDVQRQLLPADEEAQVVESSELIRMQVLLADVFFQHLRAEQKHRPHLEIITDRTQLAVNQGAGDRGQGVCSFFLPVVRINHQRLTVLGDGEQSRQSMIAQFQRVVLRI